MAIDFPNSPSTGDRFQVGTKTWEYDGTTWSLRRGMAYVDNLDSGTPTSVFVGLDSVELGLYNTNYGGLPTIDAGRP